MKALVVLGLAMVTSGAVHGATPGETSGATAAREAANTNTLLKYYPRRALAAREQGLVGFTIRIDKAGHPTNCQVTHSSGHRLLDEETCALMLIHGVFKPVTDAAGNRVSEVTEGVVNWKIPGVDGGAIVAPTKVAAANAPEKMICKRELKTGSLADYERTCMTRSEWRRMSDQMKEPWEEIKRNAITNGN